MNLSGGPHLLRNVQHSSATNRQVQIASLAVLLSLLCSSQAQVASSVRESKIVAAEKDVSTGNFADATSLLAEVLHQDSHSGADSYRLLAFSQSRQNSNYLALATCEQGLVIYPGSDSLAALYVSILQNTLPPDDQRTRLEERLGTSPDSPVFLKALGELLLTADFHSTRALKLLSRAAELSPLDAEAHFFYGESTCFNQSDELCIRELRRAHDLAPHNQQANMQIFTLIAVSEDKLGQSASAEKDFALAMKSNRSLQHPSAYAALKFVTFLSAAGRPNESMSIVGEILAWDPSYGPAHFERAKYLSDHGKKKDAIPEAELALKYQPSTDAELRSYHAFLARTYFALGRQSEAEIHQKWIEAHQQN